MKTQFNAQIDVTAADALRERARKCGAPIGELLGLFIRFGLAKISDEQLMKWAETQSAKPPAVLRRNERAMLEAFEVLAEREPGAFRFSAHALADAAGLPWISGYQALRSLGARALVTGHDLEEVDRWGRPVRSFWRKVTP